MKKWLVVIIPVVIIGVCATAFLCGRFLSENLDKKHTVTFYSNDGTVLKVDSVNANSSALPPVSPRVTYGTVFKSWDKDFSSVTKDLEIYPICENIQGRLNVLAVHSVYSQKGQKAYVPIQLCGDVCVSGLDITIRYNSELLKLESVEEDQAVVYNDEVPGIIRLNYVSSENTVADVDICNLSFLVEATGGEIPITVEINDIYAFEASSDAENNNLYMAESNVIDGMVFVVQGRDVD